jgi:hypothetical protein
VHMAARAAGSEMLAVLLDAMPEQERTDLINQADRSGITAVFLAFQRWVACPSLRQEERTALWRAVVDMLMGVQGCRPTGYPLCVVQWLRGAGTADASGP